MTMRHGATWTAAVRQEVLDRAGDLSAVSRPADVIGVARGDRDWPGWWAVWICDTRTSWTADVTPEGTEGIWLALCGIALRYCSPDAVVRWERGSGDADEWWLVLRSGRLLDSQP